MPVPACSRWRRGNPDASNRTIGPCYDEPMSNRQTLLNAIRCFGDRDSRPDYFELYSVDIVLHGYRGIGPGLESVKKFYNSFWEIFPDARIEIDELVEEGDVLVVRHTTTGTQQQDFMGISATGRKLELPGISVLHFRNGQCYERWTCSDSLLLLNQLRG